MYEVLGHFQRKRIHRRHLPCSRWDCLCLIQAMGTMELRFGGFVKRLVRHVPFHSIRIIIVTWQILRQVSEHDVHSFCNNKTQ